MVGDMKAKLKKDTGAVMIVEAAFVFPVMFIVLFFLIYLGNAYYIKSQIESIVVENAINGANYCADPMLATIKEKGSVPSVNNTSVEPYRYLFGGMDEVETKISKQVIEDVKNSTISIFKNMTPKLKTNRTEIAKFHNYILYSTFTVDVKYEIAFPISFFGNTDIGTLKIKSHAEIPVNDATEFIRNTDMVLDYFSETGLGKKIGSTFEKLNEFLEKFAGNGEE